ncbi:MAG: peptide chain release factor N(5)-glutamine methyltransferase [Armatimonadota bacterium]|jgi:release factor glutamine methyltransferase
MKLRDAIKEAQSRLEESGVPEADFDARALAAHVLGLRLSQLAVQQERLLTGEEMAALDTLATARGRREPLQYLLGTTEFYGREFICDPRALIPRPDTEALIDVSLELIGDLGLSVVADLGTGGGVIAITLAAEFRELEVFATDTSEAALELAAENVARHRVKSRVALMHGPWLTPLIDAGAAKRVQMIVSNPPYIRDDEFDGLMPEITEHEPREALVDREPDGMGAYRAIITQASSLPNLRAAAFEVGEGQAIAVADLMREALGAREIIIRKDLGRIDRVVAAVLGIGEQ